MAALPCKDCLTGNVHGDEPQGTTTTLHGLPTYVAEPPGNAAPKGIIVVHTDAFGWDLPNSRTLADRYAKRTGCRVYVPDFMNGNGVSHEVMDSMEYLMDTQPTWAATAYKIFPLVRAVTSMTWFMFKCRMSLVWPRTAQFFKDLRANEAKDGLKIGVAGFCFGGLYTMTLAKDKEKASGGLPLIDCGFTAHPSMLTTPKDGNEAVLPVSVIVGDIDFALDKASAQKIQAALEANKHVNHEMTILPKAKHGFAVRWNPHNEMEAEQAAQAEDTAVKWFTKHLVDNK